MSKRELGEDDQPSKALGYNFYSLKSTQHELEELGSFVLVIAYESDTQYRGMIDSVMAVIGATVIRLRSDFIIDFAPKYCIENLNQNCRK